MSRQKCQDQAGHLFWLHPMHLMHQPQMTAALIYYLQLCLSCRKLFPWRTKKTREQYCCQPDFLFKTMAEKTRPHEGKRKGRTIVFVQRSPSVPGESHMPGFFCLSENAGLFSRCTHCFSILLQGDSGGRQTKHLTPVSYPSLTGKSQDPYNPDTFSLKMLPFYSGLNCNWKLLTRQMSICSQRKRNLLVT